VPTKNIPSCSVRVWRASARHRRASGARHSRNVAFSRLQSIGGSLRLPLLQNGACDFRLTPLLSILMLVTQTWREIVSLLPRFRIVAMSMQRL
jgi:hypothetical protein